MASSDHLLLGRYIPGDTLLHRFDPRLKLPVAAALIIAAFALPHPLQTAALVVPAGALMMLSGIGWRTWFRGAWALRWLFLFTLLLHLLLSPGRTLFGTAWLSLDGLIQGVLVDLRLLLALLFSSGLTLTSAPEKLAAGFAVLIAPLARIGVPTRRIAERLQLVLHFMPLLREEAGAVFEEGRRTGCDPRRGNFPARVRALRLLLAPLLLRLVDRADALALAVTRGERPFRDAAAELAASPLERRQIACLCGVGGYLLLVTVLLP